MNEYQVTFSARADDLLAAAYLYISAKASPEVAKSFTAAIAKRCNGLGSFPYRGTPREDLGPGIRTLAFRRRVTIAYVVEPGDVTILGMFYAGQDFEAVLPAG